MNTKLLLGSSAVFMAILGIAATFLPEEIGTATGMMNALIIQIAGALYLGAAANNWMARGATVGGIYNRPLAMGNLLHFLVAAIALLKVIARTDRRAPMIALAIVYSAFALGFFFTVFLSTGARSER
jgi:hypothetical protein